MYEDMKISCDGLPVSEHWWLIILGLVIIEIILEKVSSEFRAQCEESQIACDFIRKGVGMMPSVQKKTHAVSSHFGTLASGTSLNVRLTSAGGMDYIKIVELI